MMLPQSVFFEIEFWALVITSIALPPMIYCVLMRVRAISQQRMLFFSFILILMAATDVYLLKHLSQTAKNTPSLIDDAMFNSELSLALYIFPALFAGVGINMLSHILIRHLERAERRFEREHPE